MATISLASMLREAESAAYRIRAEAQGLSAVRADIPNPTPPTPNKPELEIPTIPTTGAKALEEEKARVEAEQQRIQQNEQQVIQGEKLTKNDKTPESGILLSDVIDLADSLVGRSIFDLA